MSQEAFLLMDQWLAGLKADGSESTLEQKVLATRPAATADHCLLSADATQSVKVADAQVCDADKYLKPLFSPRQVAGSPRTEDILKCQLKPLDANDYGGALSPAQRRRTGRRAQRKSPAAPARLAGPRPACSSRTRPWRTRSAGASTACR